MDMPLWAETLLIQAKSLRLSDKKQNEEEGEVYFTTTALNIRRGASKEDYIVAVIPENMEVTIISYRTSWSKVQFRHKTGYVATRYLKKKNQQKGVS